MRNLTATICLTITLLLGSTGVSWSADKKVGWNFNGGILSPRCLPFVWSSGDNFELLAEKNNITDIDSFLDNPGIFYGYKINDYSEIRTGWDKPEYLEFFNKVVGCLDDHDTQVSAHGFVEFIDPKPDQSVYSTINEIRYIYISDVDLKICQSLAKELKSKCASSALIKIGDWQGGSRGFYWTWGVYGIFDIPIDGETIFLLKTFETEISSIDFLNVKGR